MTNLNEKISRRKFLQLTAGAAIGAAMLNVPGMTFAAGAKVKAANYNKLPDAVPLAKDAELVQLSYKKIQDAVSSIKDSTLRSMTAEIINNPNPAFMENYQLPGSKRALYNKLAAAGLLYFQNFRRTAAASIQRQAAPAVLFRTWQRLRKPPCLSGRAGNAYGR